MNFLFLAALFIPSIFCDVDIKCDIEDMKFGESEAVKSCIAQSFKALNESEIITSSVNITNIQGLYVNNSESEVIPTGLSALMPSIKFLTFKDSKLKKISENSLKNLTELLEVNFHKNQLTELTDGAFKDNLKIQKINLSSNQITKINSCSFSRLNDLKELNLNDNKLQTLPAGLFQNNLNLIIITMQINIINELPVTLFHQLKELQTVNLDFNELKALPDRMFIDCDKLTGFTATFNFIDIIGEDITKRCEDISCKFDNNNCNGSEEISYEKCQQTCELSVEWLLQEINEIKHPGNCA